MKCNLALCLTNEKFMLCLSRKGCKKSIMLKEKVVCFVDLAKAFGRVLRKALEWAVRYTRSFG